MFFTRIIIPKKKKKFLQVDDVTPAGDVELPKEMKTTGSHALASKHKDICLIT